MTETITASDVRAEVLAAVPPPLGRAEYAITDPDIVDPCIADAVTRYHDRPNVIRSAWQCIQSRCQEPAVIARIETKIAEHYANPVITRTGDRVTIDAGAPTGELRFVQLRYRISSPTIDAGEWVTAEVVRFVKLGIAKFPDASSYEVKVLVPSKMYDPEWSYLYDRPGDRLHVTTPKTGMRNYVSAPLGGDIANLKSAQTGALTPETPPPSYK